jgi:hypothetical protein
MAFCNAKNQARPHRLYRDRLSKVPCRELTSLRVNSILVFQPVARKYVKVHGKGAMIFLYGCGDRLANQLKEEGVLVLDCSGNLNGLDLTAVQEHQRTWCADSNGTILI